MPNSTASVTPSFTDLLISAVEEPGRLHEAFTRFHNYSLGNMILAWQQCTTRGLALGPLATYRAWQVLGRQVQKGSTAIALIQPVTVTRTATDEADGTTETVRIQRFTLRAKWFVLAQTEGQPYALPALPTWDKDRALAALAIAELPFTSMNGNAQGYAIGRGVAINPVTPEPLATLIHEVAHIVLGHTAEQALPATEQTPRNLAEVEAESVTLLVLGTLQQPGLAHCRGYIQHWLKGGVIPERSAQRIFKAADTVLRAGREVMEVGAEEAPTDIAA